MTNVKQFVRNRRAAVTLMSAMTFPILVGSAGLAAEYGDALMLKVRLQRIADAAAYSGAMAYMAAHTNDAMNHAVSRIATLNGIASAAAVASVVPSPTNDGSNAVLVTVSGDVPLGLSKLVNSSTTDLSVSASSYVEIKSNTVGQACIIGLLATSGSNTVKVSGGSTVTGTNCVVASRSNVYVDGGSNLNAQAVYAKGTIPDTNSGSHITTTPTANNIVQNYAGTIGDPVAGNAALQTAFSNLSSLSGTVANPSTPASSVNLNFQWSPTGPNDPTYPYYSSGGVYNTGTLPCGNGSSYSIYRITVAGGVSVHISATPGCNYTVASGINNTGNLLQIDGIAGSWYVNGGVATGSTPLVLNAGTFWIGGGINVGGSGTLTLANSNTIYVNGGITTGGSSTTNLIANSYRIAGAVNLAGTVNWRTTGSGASAQFYSPVSLGSGGGTFTFGDGAYSFNGNVQLSSGPTYFGNSQLSISGNLRVSSGASLCGTPAPCGSGTTRMTIVDNGTNTFDGGSTENIQAPAVGASYGIPGIALASNYSYYAAGTYSQNFTGGTSGKFSGVLYFPNSSVQFSGGAGVAGTGCLEIIGNVVYFTGGSSTATVCAGFGGQIGSPPTAMLVR